MKNRMTSSVAVLLAALTVFMTYPLIAVAQTVVQESASSDNDTAPLDLSEVEILCEEISKRGESEKHFKLSDGSFIAVQYSEPVHYLGEEGSWHDIDNSLIFNAAESSADFDGYINASNSFTAKFADNVDDALFYISNNDGGHKLSFSLVDNSSNTVEAVITEEATVMSLRETSILARNEEMIACDDVTSEISYGEIIDDVDFSYNVTGEGVKENIIINRSLDDYDFTFRVECDGLVLSLNETGSITASDSDGNTVYTIPAPFMYDADGHYSDKVQYELLEQAGGNYTLTISADDTWINGEDISFPVTVDPIVSTTQNGCSTIDVSVNSFEPNVNYYENSISAVGKIGDGAVSRTYLTWGTFSTMQSGNVIVSAELNYMYLAAQNGTCSVELHEVNETWDPSTITWNISLHIQKHMGGRIMFFLIYQMLYVIKMILIEQKRYC